MAKHAMPKAFSEDSYKDGRERRWLGTGSQNMVKGEGIQRTQEGEGVRHRLRAKDQSTLDAVATQGIVATIANVVIVAAMPTEKTQI